MRVLFADAFHRRKVMAESGVSGTEGLRMNTGAAISYVRHLRDGFVRGMVESTNQYNKRSSGNRPFSWSPPFSG